MASYEVFGFVCLVFFFWFGVLGVCLFVFCCFVLKSIVLCEDPSTISCLHHGSLCCLWLLHLKWRKCLIPAPFLSSASGKSWVRAAEAT